MAIPKPKVFWPILINTTNREIPVRVGATDYTANIAVGTYLSAADLATACATALNALGTGGLWGISLSADGIISISNNLNAWTLRMGFDLTNTAYAVLGFFQVDIASVPASGSHWVQGAYQHANGWYSPVAVKTDTGDMIDEPNSVVTVTMGDQNKALKETELVLREVEFGFLPPEYTFLGQEGSGSNKNRALENWWRLGRGKFRYWPDATVEGTSGDYFLDGDTVAKFQPKRQFDRKALYTSGTMRMRKYVP